MNSEENQKATTTDIPIVGDEYFDDEFAEFEDGSLTGEWKIVYAWWGNPWDL